MSARRALVTGVGGQDGALLARLLVDNGYNVAGTVRRDHGAQGIDGPWPLQQVRA